MEFYPTQYLIYKPNEEDNEREVIFIREDDLYTVCFFEGALVNLEREKLSISDKNKKKGPPVKMDINFQY
jgi:hypothetical protein